MITTAGISTTGLYWWCQQVWYSTAGRRDKETPPNHICRQRARRRRDDRNYCTALMNRRSEFSISFHETQIPVSLQPFVSLHGHCNLPSAFFCGDTLQPILFVFSPDSLSWLHLPAFILNSGSSRNKCLGTCSRSFLSQNTCLKNTITVRWIPLP